MTPLSVINIESREDLTIKLYFSDNSEKVVDVGDFIRRHPHPQYDKYLNWKHFKKATIENGNVVWGKNWDLIFPIEQLHQGQLI